MKPLACLLCLSVLLTGILPTAARCDDESPSAVGPVMKLLRSGRVPAARLEQILAQVASRGNGHDLAYLYRQAVVENAYDDPLRTRVLEMLVQAAAERGVTPVGDVSGIAQLIRSAPARSTLQELAVRLAGLWKVAPAADPLAAILNDPDAPASGRDAALQAIRRLGGDSARKVILQLTAPDRPLPLRLQGAAALVGVDLQAAATQTATILQDADAQTDLQQVVSSFLDRQGGSDVLAGAIESAPPPADVARRALRAMYAVGRSDARLSSVLGTIAGIDSDPQPLSRQEVLALVPVVEARGDAVRGEAVFRRADLSCMKCHALSKAGGQVGPDLSAVGASSPIDYLLHSISDPDQQIKEAYATRVVVTDEGLVLQGIVANRTADTLLLKDAAGKLVSIPNESIEEEIEGRSLMPRGLRKFMTEGELLDLVKFLSMLGKPGTEYAVRSTPRMQRWRVLTEVPEQFLEQVPDFTSFENHIYRAPTSLPVYARVGGEVPLDEVTTRLRQPVVYLVGEVEVTQPGPVGVRLDSAAGVTMWVDKHLAQQADPVVELPTGRHPITLRIDTQQRESDTLKLELFRPTGSNAQFTVVDGA